MATQSIRRLTFEVTDCDLRKRKLTSEKNGMKMVFYHRRFDQAGIHLIISTDHE